MVLSAAYNFTGSDDVPQRDFIAAQEKLFLLHTDRQGLFEES